MQATSKASSAAPEAPSVWPSAGYALDDELGIALSTQAPAGLRHILLNVVGFGGGHASLVLEDGR